ncbi:hypothetical protein AB1Y20_022775 [Prymnesium parvum]|uniref:Uncharacterized protein n=1 Tax=Prymnesium parvum TaxID=97485 RepID=A0AB34JH98_PRYPA
MQSPLAHERLPRPDAAEEAIRHEETVRREAELEAQLQRESAAAKKPPPNAEAAVVSTCTYRFWIFTSPQDPGGEKGEVSLCLTGALGSKWFVRLNAFLPPEELYSGRCEFFQESEDVGTLHTLTLEYGASVTNRIATDLRFGQEELVPPAANSATKSAANSTANSAAKSAAARPGKDSARALAGAAPECAAWWLSHVIVRNSVTGMVAHFPNLSGSAITGPTRHLSLEPRLTWHEDRFGNISEQPPETPAAQQWFFPESQFATPLAAERARHSGSLVAQYADAGMAILDEIYREEMLPLVDQVVQELRISRTAGTFAHDCTQAISGVPVEGSAKSSLQGLRRRNLMLMEDVKKIERTKDEEARALRVKLDSTLHEVHKLSMEKEAETRLRLEAEQAARRAEEQSRNHPSRLCVVQ